MNEIPATEAAKRLNISVQQVYALLKGGRLKGHAIVKSERSRRYVSEASLNEYMGLIQPDRPPPAPITVAQLKRWLGTLPNDWDAFVVQEDGATLNSLGFSVQPESNCISLSFSRGGK